MALTLKRALFFLFLISTLYTQVDAATRKKVKRNDEAADPSVAEVAQPEAEQVVEVS